VYRGACVNVHRLDITSMNNACLEKDLKRPVHEERANNTEVARDHTGGKEGIGRRRHQQVQTACEQVTDCTLG
jgi:hypothetical protein